MIQFLSAAETTTKWEIPSYKDNPKPIPYLYFLFSLSGPDGYSWWQPSWDFSLFLLFCAKEGRSDGQWACEGVFAISVWLVLAQDPGNNKLYPSSIYMSVSANNWTRQNALTPTSIFLEPLPGKSVHRGAASFSFLTVVPCTTSKATTKLQERVYVGSHSRGERI